jgi:hypothetical protein
MRTKRRISDKRKEVMDNRNVGEHREEKKKEIIRTVLWDIFRRF